MALSPDLYIYILFFLISLFLSHIHPPCSLSITLLFLVGETLAGFFPAAGGAPLILALHSVHLAALFGLPATLPADVKTDIVCGREGRKGRLKRLMWSVFINMRLRENR